MSQQIIVSKDVIAMPEMDMSSASKVREHLTRPLTEIYTKEEMEAIHRAIRYTQMYKQDEARERMDTEELLTRPMPKLTKKQLKELGRQ